MAHVHDRKPQLTHPDRDNLSQPLATAVHADEPRDEATTKVFPTTGPTQRDHVDSKQPCQDHATVTSTATVDTDSDGVAVRELAKSVLLGIIGFVLLCVGVRVTQELPGWTGEYGLFVTMLPFYLFMMLAGALFVPGVKAVWQAIRPSK